MNLHPTQSQSNVNDALDFAGCLVFLAWTVVILGVMV